MMHKTRQRNVDTSVYRRADTVNEQRYQAMVEQTSDGIFFFNNESDRVLHSNAALRRMLGFSVEELLGMKFSDFIVHDHTNVDAGSQQRLAGGQSSLVESRCICKDGTFIEIEASVSPLFYANRREWCAIVRDITKRKMHEECLKRGASHDPLTDLPNRALFMESLERAIAEASRRQTPIGVLFVDLDDFKEINDTFGHHTGDMVLMIVANRLKSCVRTGDMVARIGGDEFTVLIEHPSGREELTHLAERLVTLLREPFLANGTNMQTRISASIGVSMSFPSTLGGADVLHRTDLAMYSAKEAGKARWAFTENRGRTDDSGTVIRQAPTQILIRGRGTAGSTS